MKKYLSLFLLLLAGFFAKAQELQIPLNDDYDMGVSRAAYSSDYFFHTSMRAWSEFQFKDVTNIDSLNNLYRIKINRKGKFSNYILNSILNDDFVRVKGDEYYVAINPYIDFEAGKDGSRSTWVNKRGVEIKGTIGKNFAFYSNIRENQAVFPEHVEEYCVQNNVVPGQGLANRFRTNGRDFTNAAAYITYRPAKWLNATLGYGKNFVGDGYRSLLLSDNASNYPYVKATAEFWRIQYTCIYAQMTDRHKTLLDRTYPRKWAVIHYFDLAVSKRFNIGFFDAVMAKAQDSMGNGRGLDFQYVNPLIFLRSAEYYSGSSPDNAVLGLNASFIIGKHTTIYGQFVLDEMTFKKFFAFNGYAGNKQAYQLGVKSYDCFGVEGLFLQLEGNIVRPYMYSHTPQGTGCGVGEDNWAHYNEPLAHPWGANLWEMVFRSQYNWKRMYFQYKLNFGQYGDDVRDANGNVIENYGHNVYNDYNTAVDLGPDWEGHYLLTGVKTTVMMNDFVVSYLLNPSYNLNVFAEVTQRHFEVENADTKNNFIFSFGIRTSLDRKYYDF